jgi:hypothetical protein
VGERGVGYRGRRSRQSAREGRLAFLELVQAISLLSSEVRMLHYTKEFTEAQSSKWFRVAVHVNGCVGRSQDLGTRWLLTTL